MTYERPEWVQVEPRGDVTVLHLNGNACEDAKRYRVEMHELLRIPDEATPHILLNFNRLKNLRGPELTPLMRLAMRVRERNGRIAACHLPAGMQDLLEVARLDRVVTVYDNQEQAIREMLLPPPACA